MSALVLLALFAAQAPAPVGAAPPVSPPGTLQEELRRARDEGAVLEDRLAAARRAHALAHNAETAALVKATFLDVERGQLARSRSFERLRTSCTSPDAAPLSVEACVRELLREAAASRAFVDLQGDELVTVALAREPDVLWTVRGLVRRATQQGGQLTLDLELQRARSPRDATLEALLLPAPSSPAAPATAPRAAGFRGPVISEGARRLLGALPDRFLELSGEPAHRFIQERCHAAPPARGIAVSLLGQAQLSFQNAAERSVEAIVDAWKVERGVELAFEGGRTVRILWPTAEKNVADFSGVAWATTDTFPRKPALGCTQ